MAKLKTLCASFLFLCRIEMGGFAVTVRVAKKNKYTNIKHFEVYVWTYIVLNFNDSKKDDANSQKSLV